eukprot:3218842-Amphidinium_carterae.1
MFPDLSDIGFQELVETLQLKRQTRQPHIKETGTTPYCCETPRPLEPPKFPKNEFVPKTRGKMGKKGMRCNPNTDLFNHGLNQITA